MNARLLSPLLLLLGVFCTSINSSPANAAERLLQRPVDATPGGEEIVRFSFRFGFFDDDLTPTTEITRRDVEGVICQIQYFFSHMVQDATESKSIHARATEINWGYYESSTLPAHINFTITLEDSAIAGDVNGVDEQILIHEMEQLGASGLQEFITNWVWEAEPDNNFFFNANRMAFDGNKMAPVKGMMDNAECPETLAPSMSPTISPMPTQSPTISPMPSTAPANEDNLLNDPNASTQSPEDEEEGAGEDTASNEIIPPVNEAWPFGESKESLVDVQPMANFQLSFGIEEGHERPPRIEDMNGMICQLDQFFTDHLRKVMVDYDIKSKAVYIDWFLDETATGKNDIIIVNFTSYSTYGDSTATDNTQVAADDVFAAMRLTAVELQDLVKDYIWKSAPVAENMFYHTVEVAMTGEMNNPKPTQAMMTQADCTPPSPTASPAPTTAESDNGGPGSNNSSDQAFDDNNSTITAPVPADQAAEFGGDAQQVQIFVSFVVSNIENIRDPVAIKASGLMQSFPVFANEVIANMTKREETRLRGLLAGSGAAGHHRRLRMATVPGSARVTSVNEIPCPENALPGLTCHDVEARYDVIMTSDEDKDQIKLDTTSESQLAVDNGNYNGVLQRVDPDTPLYIGILTDEEQIPVPEGDEDTTGQEEEPIVGCTIENLNGACYDETVDHGTLEQACRGRGGIAAIVCYMDYLCESHEQEKVDQHKECINEECPLARHVSTEDCSLVDGGDQETPVATLLPIISPMPTQSPTISPTATTAAEEATAVVTASINPTLVPNPGAGEIMEDKPDVYNGTSLCNETGSEAGNVTCRPNTTSWTTPTNETNNSNTIPAESFDDETIVEPSLASNNETTDVPIDAYEYDEPSASSGNAGPYCHNHWTMAVGLVLLFGTF